MFLVRLPLLLVCLLLLLHLLLEILSLSLVPLAHLAAFRTQLGTVLLHLLHLVARGCAFRAGRQGNCREGCGDEGKKTDSFGADGMHIGSPVYRCNQYSRADEYFNRAKTGKRLLCSSVGVPPSKLPKLAFCPPYKKSRYRYLRCMDNWNLNKACAERPSKPSPLGSGYLGRVGQVKSGNAQGRRNVLRIASGVTAISLILAAFLVFAPESSSLLLNTITSAVVLAIAGFTFPALQRVFSDSGAGANQPAGRSKWTGIGPAGAGIGIVGAVGANMWDDDENLGDDAFPSSSISGDSTDSDDSL